MLCILLMFWATIGYSQIQTKHPIDIQVENCHLKETNQTTMGMIECEELAQKLWDQELNRNYQTLMKVLNRQNKDLLRTAQRNWLIYRDHEWKFAGTFYAEMDGTLWRIVAMGRRKDVTRTRALELQEYLEAVDN